MSRRGGLQPKTLSMYKTLDDRTEEWASLLELTEALCNGFGVSRGRAYNIIGEWAAVRGARVRSEKAGRTVFYCSREGLSLDAAVIAERLWGKLPERFRKDHDIKRKAVSAEERMYATLTAAGWLLYSCYDCGVAFNKWAAKNEIAQINLRPNFDN